MRLNYASQGCDRGCREESAADLITMSSSIAVDVRYWWLANAHCRLHMAAELFEAVAPRIGADDDDPPADHQPNNAESRAFPLLERHRRRRGRDARQHHIINLKFVTDVIWSSVHPLFGT